ncbi:hypothetical protein [Tritonibacter mobilis]|uniref:hypothetical protein n=1 Tax=Tritonibacter mobilis TaxID=379347 RepID=UPI0039A77B19
MFEEFPALQDHLTETATPTQKSGKGGIDQWRVQVQLERFEMIQSAIGTVPRSRERAKALRAIAASAKPCWGSSEPPTVKTLRLWLQAYDERGLIGLMPKAPVTKGKTRVLLSQTWDRGIDLTEDRRVKVATQLDSYTRSLIAKSMSARKARSLAAKKLVELSIEAGSVLSRANLSNICKVTQKYTDRFDAYRRVARHDFDNKAFFDKDRPRISRGRCAWPMEVVYGDVHPIDIYMEAADGHGQRRLRLIAWMDDCTRYMWATVAVLGKGRGIRQTDIADSLFNVVCDPVGGVARTLYLDNGGEYAALGEAMAEIPGAIDALSELGGVVKAMPYNGPAKGLLEHSFSTLEQGYFKHISGWIGGDRTNKKTHAVGKPIKGFEGTVEDLVKSVLDMVAAYNHASQGGQLNGLSPKEAMQDAIERGWQSVTMDVDSFDFAFSRREDREIRQGGFRFRNAWWSSDATCRLGAGDLVNLRVPLRSNAEGIFVLHDGQRLDERALPDKQYHPLDRDGARESARRNKLQEQEIRRIRSYVDSNIDPATEILRGVNLTPLSVVAGATIGLDDAGPRHQELARIERQRAQMIEIAEDFGWAGYSQERRAEGN